LGYLPISVRAAMHKIRDKQWVLPVTQRPYVWGDRVRFKEGIYRLFDSLYRNYPIGTFLLWETAEEIPYREFLQDFDPDAPLAKPVERGVWSRQKSLIYDGQQRLQSLYSCLQHTYCGQVLCFDLRFESTSANTEAFGFSFEPANAVLPPHSLRVNALYHAYYGARGRDGVTEFRRHVTRQLAGVSDEQVAVAERNVEKLWRLFNDETYEVCGYFTMPSDLGRSDVQEIFVRLNSGGVPPSQADLVFSMIAVEAPDFQVRIQELTEEIQAATHIELSIYDVLQILNFLQYKTPRVDLARVRRGEVSIFASLLDRAEDPVKAFYKRFLHDEFQINSSSIYRSQVALLPVIAYFYHKQVRTCPRGEELARLKRYFILSQVNDWTPQGILSAVAGLIESTPEFPLERIIEQVKNTTGTARSARLTERAVLGMPEFILKVLEPRKAFSYIEARGRLNPEVEHIFPRNPKETDLPSAYGSGKMALWNLELGVPGDINAEKLQKMPQDYFRSRQGLLSQHYHLLPEAQIEEPIWDYHNVEMFWGERRRIMLKELRALYGLDVVSE